MRPFKLSAAYHRLLSAALLACLLVPGQAAAVASCAQRPAARPALSLLSAAMTQGRFVSYQPTQIQIHQGKATRADEAGIAADLAVLRPRFDGLILYGVLDGADRVVDVAARLGFRAVILGVWNLDKPRELDLALAAATRQPQLVVGLSLGNERVLAGATSLQALATRLQQARARAPQLLWTSTEPFHLYEQAAAQPLLAQMDFMLVNVHPAFQPWFRSASDADTARFVVNVVHDLSALYCGPVLVKETGVPTAPASMGFTAQRQAGFWRSLKIQFPPHRLRAFAFFSAFDAPWRVTDEHPTAGPQPQEGSWGLYDAQRSPKISARELAVLRASSAR
jgi:exo-beta-1,3-glucanase (GH17 family)